MLPNELTEVALHRLGVCPLCRGAFGEVPETMTVRDPFGVSAQEFSLEKCSGQAYMNIIQPRQCKSKMCLGFGVRLSGPEGSGHRLTSGNRFSDSIFTGKLEGCPAGQSPSRAGYFDVNRL